MALIKEDGSIVANADTYADLTDLAAYVVEYSITLTASTDAEKESLLRRAMDYLDRYVDRWKGERVSTSQSLAWPRTDVFVDGVEYASTDIPRRLFAAQLKLAVTADTTDLLPVTDSNEKGPVIEETVHGAVTVKYANTGKLMRTPFDADADVQLRPLLRHGGLTTIRV